VGSIDHWHPADAADMVVADLAPLNCQRLVRRPTFESIVIEFAVLEQHPMTLQSTDCAPSHMESMKMGSLPNSDIAI